MKRKLLWMLSIIMLVSCQQDFLPEPAQPETRTEQTVEESPFAISPEEALANLNGYIEGIQADAKNPSSFFTLGNSKKVESLMAVTWNGKSTRGESASNGAQNLIYVANFKGNQGYAILSADKRIEEPILAYVESGTFTQQQLNALETMYDDESRPVFEGYPTDGPEFFTDANGVLRLNPNTATLYCDSIGEYMIGNLTPVNPKNNINSEDIYDVALADNLFNELCFDYARRSINRYGDVLNNLVTSWDPNDLELGGGIGLPSVVSRDTIWNINKQVEPMLGTYKYWHQRTPFNDLYPNAMFSSHTAAAGCFPLAIAKLLSYFNQPANLYHGNYLINWALMQKPLLASFNYTSFIDSQSNVCAAHLLRQIMKKCKSTCFPEGTFTLPSNAKSFLRSVGFKNAKNQNYKFEHIVNMLDKGHPTIISGFPGVKIWEGHAWNMDGYKTGERTITITYSNGQKSSGTRRLDMVHCDFGWKNKHNGYYVSNLFKLNNEYAEIDEGSNSNGNTQYDNLFYPLKLIIYDEIVR